MCGIAGFWSKTKATGGAPRITQELIFVNQLRGRDATGAFSQHRDEKDLRWCKLAGGVDHFLNWKRPHEEILKDADEMRFVVAHNRAATIGDPLDIEAAHPHKVGNIMLVHNGTLRSGFDTKLVSDSFQIALWLDQDPDFLAVRDKIYGAYALVWHDARDDSLNFVRNIERTLGFVETDGGNTTWFASETKMLELVLSRNNKTIGKIHQLPENVWAKVMPDGTVTQVDVPLYNGMWSNTSDSVEPKQIASLFDTKESDRVWSTISQGGTGMKFSDCKVDYSEDRKPKKRHQSTGSTTGGQYSGNSTSTVEDTTKKTKPFIRLPKWQGYENKSDVWFYPIVGAPGVLPDRMILTGALMTFDGSPKGMSFVEGVEVKANVSAEWIKKMGEHFEERMSFVRAQDVIHKAAIHNIIFDLNRKKIVLWCSESEPEDWWSREEYKVDTKDIYRAWNAKYKLGPDDVDATVLTTEEIEILSYIDEDVGTKAASEVLPPEKKSDGHLSFQPVGLPFGVECGMCNERIPNVHEEEVWQYFLKYHPGVEPKKRGGQTPDSRLETERLNVGHCCRKVFLEFYSSQATIDLTGRVGWAAVGRQHQPIAGLSPELTKLRNRSCPTCGEGDWMILYEGRPKCIHCRTRFTVCHDTYRNDYFLDEDQIDETSSSAL